MHERFDAFRGHQRRGSHEKLKPNVGAFLHVLSKQSSKKVWSLNQGAGMRCWYICTLTEAWIILEPSHRARHHQIYIFATRHTRSFRKLLNAPETTVEGCCDHDSLIHHTYRKVAGCFAVHRVATAGRTVLQRKCTSMLCSNFISFVSSQT